ncbi:MAG: hypothetical protein RIG61_12450 [Deltaproteobacteria bacterium]
MKLLVSMFLLAVSALALSGCDETGGGGGGFIPTGSILAVAEKAGSEETIKVGGLQGAVPPGSTVEVTNLDTGKTKTTTGAPDGSFDPTFIGDTDDTFNVLVTNNGNIVEDTVIGVTLLSDAVEENLANLGSVPADIEIRGDRAYVINGFSNNIQVFDLDQDPPGLIGTIVLPPGSNPTDMAFLDNTRAYVANNIGQSVAVVNVQTRVCETLIVRAGQGGDTQPCQEVLTVAGTPFEDPAGVAVANGKVYVSNNNLAGFSDPNGNGFISVINAETNQFITTIEATGANSTSMIVFDGNIFVVNAGNITSTPDFSEFFCDEEFPPSIDVIDPQTDIIIDTIPIPLSAENALVCLPNAIAATGDGFGYTGLGLVGALLKVDLLTGDVINGTDNPIIITGLSGLNNTADVAIRGNLLFTTLFNSDQIAVVDTDTDEVDPFPYIAPFPAGIRAFNPGSQLFDGVQSLAIRPGAPGVDFNGADIYFITGISEQLGSVDSTLGTQ